MKKKILVTGGAGYIGTHTTVELIAAGYDVVVVDNFSNSEKWILGNVEKIVGQPITLVEADCLDTKAFEKVFVDHKIDGVIHFAAFKAVGESVYKPMEYYRNNFDTLLNVLELMKKHKVANLIFSSSASVYGEPSNEDLPVTELATLRKANSPYGKCKQMGEEVLEDMAFANKDMNMIALRYFNPIGCHNSATIGELPLGVPTNLLPFVAQTAAGIRGELSIFGSDYNTPDGTCLRDFIDVVDLAKAHVCALDRLINKKNSDNYEVFNIGTGKPVSVKELIELFEEVNSVVVKHKFVARRDGDVEKVWANPKKANDVLGWKALNDTKLTLENAWKWQQYLDKRSK